MTLKHPPSIRRAAQPATEAAAIVRELHRAARELRADVATVGVGYWHPAPRVRSQFTLWEAGERAGRYELLGRGYVWEDAAAADAFVRELRSLFTNGSPRLEVLP